MKQGLLFIGFCVMLLSPNRMKAQEALANQILLYSTANPEVALPFRDSSFTIKDITVIGIKRTRQSTVLRELSFHTGESYPLPEIVKKLDETQKQLMNTGLFRNVVVYLRSFQADNVFVTVDVEEKWYLYPQPFVRVANGTFSQWNERGRKLEHLNYGIKFTQYNFSGRNDKMYVKFNSGYTHQVALQYQGFYLDKDLKWSSSVNFSYGKNRELNYATEFNKLLPVKDPNGYLYEFYQSSIEINFRPAIKTRHSFSIGYNYNRIADTVSKLNANFAPSKSIYRYLEASYGVSFTDLDYKPYPTKGRDASASLHKAGFNDAINLWEFAFNGTQYWTLHPKTFFSLQAAAKLKLPFEQPYITQQFLGYGDDYLQGYENYFVDGVAGGYTKATIYQNIFKKEFQVPHMRWFKDLHSAPVRVYVKAFANAGYVHNPNESLHNELNNKMLYSGGVGIDFVLFTDMIFKFEWSFNQLGQNALYLHQ